MMNIIKKLSHLRLAPVSHDADKAKSILLQELPFTVHQFTSGKECNGWIVPKKWSVKKATISKSGRLIYDGMSHPLGVAGYSTSFKGSVSLNQLKSHLFYHPTLPDALVYHCDYYYKQWKKDWGFSVPYQLFKKLPKGKYDIDLETVYEKGTMKVLDYHLKGDSKETIILNAHNCHAGQANDDISGIAVGIEVIKRLMKEKKRRWSYRLIIAPEHLGTVFYLAGLTRKTTNTFKYAIFLEMLGNNNRFALQESFTGESLIDKASHHYLKHRFSNYFSDRFRKIVGNDETVWEAPGYEIPCISLSRWPYKEYHSSRDTDQIIFENKLNEAVEAVCGIVNILETNSILQRRFKGLIALSNPKYNLYISPASDPSIREKNSKTRRWNYLMDCLTRYLDRQHSILDIAQKHDVDYHQLYDYVKKFEQKGLVKLINHAK
jgi:aminopeptidase-like protein